MNILLLHNMGHPQYWRQAVAELELGLPRYAPEHNYLVHNALLPLPAWVKDLQFDGIVLGPTFLWNRYYPQKHERNLQVYEFIKYSDAFKIALPQDDYTCSAILDRWVTDWRIDKVYTVCPQHWELLYPNYLHAGGNVALGYTGDISPGLIERTRSSKPHATRTVDVCYRASKLAPNFGRLGALKSEIAPRFIQTFQDQGWAMDISVAGKDLIPGAQWLDFIENARFTLGTNSGSSVFDPEGEIQRCVQRYRLHNPSATFEETAAACFPGQDGRYEFTAISPRVFEAGLLKTGQILIPGAYSNLLKPWQHYVPLAEDLSNKAEVAQAVNDPELLDNITSACKELLLASPEIMLDQHIHNLLGDIQNGAQSRHIYSDRTRFDQALTRYNRQMQIMAPLQWSGWIAHEAKTYVANTFPAIRCLYSHIKAHTRLE